MKCVAVLVLATVSRSSSVAADSVIDGLLAARLPARCRGAQSWWRWVRAPSPGEGLAQACVGVACYGASCLPGAIRPTRGIGMKAAVCERYGPAEVVVIKDVPMPVVGERDVLIRVKATAVNIADVRIRAVRVPRGLAIPTRLAMGIFRPRNPIFGLEVAGIVERVGASVRAFKPGERVVASRGLQVRRPRRAHGRSRDGRHRRNSSRRLRCRRSGAPVRRRHGAEPSSIARSCRRASTFSSTVPPARSA